MLSEMLSGLGYALDTPGALTRGLLAGKPGERVDPRQLLQGWGLIGDEPDDSWLSAGRDVLVGAATDPLTYLGFVPGLAGGKAAATAARAAIPLETGEALAANAGRAAGGLASTAAFREPLKDVATLRNLGRLEAGESAAGLPGRAVSQLTADGKYGAEMSGRTAAQMGKGDVRNRLSSMAQQGLGDYLDGGAYGVYSPETRTMFSTQANRSAGEAAGTLRHERIHAIIDQASKGAGEADALPALMRYPAKLKAMQSPLAQAAGAVGDELAANTLENRTLRGQLQGAASYLFEPTKNATYADAFAAAGHDPRVVAAYRYLPQGMIHAGTAAGGAAGASLGAALGGGGLYGGY